MAATLPIGLRFCPTEEELITHYLKYKMLGNDSLVYGISEINLYNYEPWELPEKSFFKSDFEWFFFRALTYKTKRNTNTGCWRATGDGRPIKARGTNKVIATRKIFVFYRGRGAKAVKTNWVIHEYHLQPETNTPPSFAVCRLKLNAEESNVSTCDQDEQNSSIASHPKKKAKRRAIREQKIQMDGQTNGQSVPLPSLVDFQSVNDHDGEVYVQPIQPAASNPVIFPDKYLDDAASTMCWSGRRSEPESALTDFGEVNDPLSLAEVPESELNFVEGEWNSAVFEAGCDESLKKLFTSNNRINDGKKNIFVVHQGAGFVVHQSKEEVSGNTAICQHQAASGDPDTDTDTGTDMAFGMRINRTSTIKEGPTITHAFAQGPTRLFELQADNSCVLSSDSDNSDLVEIESEPERERLSEDKAEEAEKLIDKIMLPLVFVGMVFGTILSFVISIIFAQEPNPDPEEIQSKAMSQDKAKKYAKLIIDKIKLPLVYVAKAFLGVLRLVTLVALLGVLMLVTLERFAEQVLLYRHAKV